MDASSSVATAVPADAGTAVPLPPLLDIVDVSKAYGGVQALGGVSVNVHEGEVLAVVGENGAGKSTLVGVAAGRVVPDDGSVSVQGDRLLSHGPAEAMKAGIRLVPQELLICPDMSVLDNVLLGQRPTQLGIFLDRRAARREVERRLDRLGVGGIDLDTPVGDLSVVQRTFVQIARGLSPGRQGHAHRRADRADGRRRGRPVPVRPQGADARGHGHRLHQPPAQGDLPARRTGSTSCGTASSWPSCPVTR